MGTWRTLLDVGVPVLGLHTLPASTADMGPTGGERLAVRTVQSAHVLMDGVGSVTGVTPRAVSVVSPARSEGGLADVALSPMVHAEAVLALASAALVHADLETGYAVPALLCRGWAMRRNPCARPRSLKHGEGVRGEHCMQTAARPCWCPRRPLEPDRRRRRDVLAPPPRRARWNRPDGLVRRPAGECVVRRRRRHTHTYATN